MVFGLDQGDSLAMGVFLALNGKQVARLQQLTAWESESTSLSYGASALVDTSLREPLHLHHGFPPAVACWRSYYVKQEYSSGVGMLGSFASTISAAFSVWVLRGPAV